MNDFMRHLLNLPEQASTIAKEIDYLHYFVAITSILTGIGIGLGTIVLMLKYRARKERASTPVVIPGIRYEAIVVAGPLIFFLAWFVIGFRQFITVYTPPKDSMDVYVMGKKWMWKFAYPEGPSSIGVLRVPAHRPVRLLITSRDVIHSFFVPAFRIKMDALPGRYTQTWFEAVKPGRYEVYCAEFCGTLHSGMLAEVIVMEPADFDDWLAQEKASPRVQDGGESAVNLDLLSGNLVEQGKRLANAYGCLKCHSTDGSAHIGPTWVGMYGRETKLEGGKVLKADEGYMTESMMDPLVKIVAGFKPVMPVFRGKLAAPEAAALVEYIKSLRGPPLPEAAKAPVYDPQSSEIKGLQK